MPTAILSVHNKTGLLDFAKGLATLGWNLLASGGTAKLLRDNNINVTEVADYTKSPELLGGRVKTLHPAIHGGLLARPTESDHNELLALADAIENIDIGGVTLIRAAAKNHERVTLVCDPTDYTEVLSMLQHGEIPFDTKKKLAVKGFKSTANYDTLISKYLDN